MGHTAVMIMINTSILNNIYVKTNLLKPKQLHVLVIVYFLFFFFF